MKNMSVKISLFPKIVPVFTWLLVHSVGSYKFSYVNDRKWPVNALQRVSAWWIWQTEREEQTHLYSAVAPVGDDDVSIGIHGHTGRSVELAVAFSMGAEFKKELAISVVDLEQPESPL